MIQTLRNRIELFKLGFLRLFVILATVALRCNSIGVLEVALYALFNFLEEIKTCGRLIDVIHHNVTALLARSACAARPVDEAINIYHALLNDHIDIINVKASRRHVRSHENCIGSGPSELVQNVQSRALHQIAVKAAKSRVVLPLIVLHLKLCLAEDKDLEVAILSDELLDVLLLGPPILAEHDLVADRVWHLMRVFPHQVNH